MITAPLPELQSLRRSSTVSFLPERCLVQKGGWEQRAFVSYVPGVGSTSPVARGHGWNTTQPNGLVLEQHEHLLWLPRGRLVKHQTVLQRPLAANPLLYHNLPPPQILKGYSHKKKWWGLPCLLPWNLQLSTVFSGMENASLVRSQKHFSAFLTSVQFIIWATVVKLLLHDS